MERPVGMVLAAGSSRRFGDDKLLYPLADGTPLVLAAVRGLRGACSRVLAPVRPGDDRLAHILSAAGCEVIVAGDADRGLGHSIAAGVRASPNTVGWVLVPGDMPFIALATYRAVVAGLRAGYPVAVPVRRGQRGHPVGFAACWHDRLIALQGDTGARVLLRAFPELLHRIPVEDAGIHIDIDRPEDLAAAHAYTPT